MIETLSRWYRRYFTHPQAVLLAILLVVGFTVVLTMGRMLAPAIAALIIAYLLEGVVRFLERRGARRFNAVLLTFLLFISFIIFLLFGVIPLLSVQVSEFFRELPTYLARWQENLMQLPQHYSFITTEQVAEIMGLVKQEVAALGQRILALSLTSLPGLITVVVYLFLVPLLVFFFLKDKKVLLGWLSGFLPRDRSLPSEVWQEVDQQMGNYVRGKAWEILIVGLACFIAFGVLGLKYAILLAVLVGLSVIVPYIGAAVVTIPVAVVAYFQWGWSSEFAWLMGVYFLIQALDGNALVPLLFSEVVNLHPVAIIIAILVFGGLWGFWGVFFAIPLATLVNAILRAWPRTEETVASAPLPANDDA